MSRTPVKKTKARTSKKSKQTNKSKNITGRLTEFVKTKTGILFVIIFGFMGTAFLVSTFASAPAVPTGYREVFKDEFDGTTVNNTNWKAYANTYGDGNFETHCYSPNNASVSNGILSILTKQQQVTCPSYSSTTGWATPYRNYTSAFLGSRDVGKYYPKYARYEVRAKSPQRLGIAPAIWLRHINGSSTVEIDLMESFQSSPGTATSTIHAINENGTLVSNAWKSTQNIGITPSWHVWAAEIEEISTTEVEIRFYLDGVLMQKNGGGAPFRMANNAKKLAFDSIGVNGFDIALNTATDLTYTGNSAPDSTAWYCRGKYWSKVSSPSAAPTTSKVAETPMKNADGSTFYRACSTWAVPTAGSIQNNPAGETFEIDYVRVLVKDATTQPPVLDITSPTVPTGLTATAVSAGRVNTAWSASTDNVSTTGYNIYRDNTKIATSPTTDYADSSVTADTTYSYTISAYDGAGNESAKSSAVSVKTPPATPTAIPAPANVTLTPAVESMSISWTKSADSRVDEYSPRYIASNSTAKNDGAAWTYPGRTTNTSTTLTGLAGGISYDVQIRAIDNLGNTDGSDDVKSEYSATAVGTALLKPVTQVDTQAPTTPTNFGSKLVYNKSANSYIVNLLWTASTDNVAVKDYIITRNGIRLGTTASVQYSDSTVTPGASYAYTVQSRDTSDNVSGTITKNVKVKCFVRWCWL